MSKTVVVKVVKTKEVTFEEIYEATAENEANALAKLTPELRAAYLKGTTDEVETAYEGEVLEVITCFTPA